MLIHPQLSFSISKYTYLLPPFLSRYSLTWPIKTPGSMPLDIPKEITDYNEMNNQILNVGIELNMWDIARNVIEPISFHRFHWLSNSTTYIWCYRHPSTSKWKMHTDKNYNWIQVLLINHLSNLSYVIRRSSCDAFSLLPVVIDPVSFNLRGQIPDQITARMSCVRIIFDCSL
jgi:hypothetical protein